MNTFTFDSRPTSPTLDVLYIVVSDCFLQCDVSRLPLTGCEGMRLRGTRDLNPDSYLELSPPPPRPVAWLPGVLSKGVRLRLRLDRRDNRGRGCWQLVDSEAESEPVGRRLRSQAPDTCAQSKSSFLKKALYFEGVIWPDCQYLLECSWYGVSV